MEPTPGMVTSQEKVAGALAYVFFMIPSMMNHKTDFTMFHARQAFVFNCIFVVAILLGVIPFIGGFLRWFIFLCLFVFGVWSAYQAYLGNKFVTPWIGDNANKLITTLGVTNLFQI